MTCPKSDTGEGAELELKTVVPDSGPKSSHEFLPRRKRGSVEMGVEPGRSGASYPDSNFAARDGEIQEWKGCNICLSRTLENIWSINTKTSPV